MAAITETAVKKDSIQTENLLPINIGIMVTRDSIMDSIVGLTNNRLGTVNPNNGEETTTHGVQVIPSFETTTKVTDKELLAIAIGTTGGISIKTFKTNVIPQTTDIEDQNKFATQSS